MRLKTLPLNSEKNYIEETINKKMQNLPWGNFIFKAIFIIFKKKSVAEEFINKNSTDEKLTKVMFTLEYDDKYKLDYNLSTHSDTNQFSFMDEEEVLFFPFSSFKVEEIEENKEKNRYEIK